MGSPTTPRRRGDDATTTCRGPWIAEGPVDARRGPHGGAAGARLPGYERAVGGRRRGRRRRSPPRARSATEPYNRAKIAPRGGDLDAAERLYLEALEIDPKFAIAMISLAGVYSRRVTTSRACAGCCARWKPAVTCCPA